MVKRFFSDPANRWMAGVFLIAAYLALANLSNAPLWHDEATPALSAKSVLRTGGLNAWDGRTMYVGNNGLSANSDLYLASYPPWPVLPSVLGFLVFGYNETGVRFFHALLGVISLLLLWQLLRMDFPHKPRLRVTAFALFALSAQTILFFRMGRYVADAFFFALATFYAYRLYIAPGGRWWHLAAAACAAVLGFLNHYTIGAAFALALAAWHLLYHAKSTTRRQWAEISAATAVAAAVCFGYLLWAGVIFSGENLEFPESDYPAPWYQRKFYITLYHFFDLIWLGWLPFWVAVWLMCFIALHIAAVKNRRAPALMSLAGGVVIFHLVLLNPTHYMDKLPHFLPNHTAVNFIALGLAALVVLLTAARLRAQAQHSPPTLSALQDTHTHMLRWTALGALFLFFSGLLSLQTITYQPLAASRYIAPALIFLALIKAGFVETLWRKKKGAFLALPALLLLLLSNLFTLPYAYPRGDSENAVHSSLISLIGEIHRPYDGYLRKSVAYLNEHAAPDDTIYVEPWQDYTVLQFYLSDKLIFCCALDENSPLPEEKVRALGAPLYKGDVQPDWQVLIEEISELPDKREYELLYRSNTYDYPTQRPELEMHTFAPLPMEKRHLYYYNGYPSRMHIFRKIRAAK